MVQCVSNKLPEKPKRYLNKRIAPNVKKVMVQIANDKDVSYKPKEAFEMHFGNRWDV